MKLVRCDKCGKDMDFGEATVNFGSMIYDLCNDCNALLLHIIQKNAGCCFFNDEFVSKSCKGAQMVHIKGIKKGVFEK
jgi:NAD-dependent SIR2 family protein deacetylase